mgnify:FL=1
MKLNQVIAIEKGVKSRVYSELTEFDKVCQKPDLFQGFSKSYEKKDEDGESLPPESKKVQFRVDNMLKAVATSLTEFYNVTASKDWANMGAVADIEVDGMKLLRGVPVTYLLFLEKQLTDLRTFFGHLPELDDTENWQRDETSGMYKTEPISTHRTKKLQKPIVLYDATKEHPAQTQLITEDVLAGYWKTIKHSGGVPKTRKDKIVARVEALIKAVKFAREEANGTDAERRIAGENVFDYLLMD